MRRISYGKQCIDKRDIQEVAKVLRSDFITQGPKVVEFEELLAGYCGAKYAVAVSSGTAALHIACLAAGLKKQDEVITTPMTFVATANSILYTGAKPVFADIDPETANIDTRKISAHITGKTKAILPVHFAGLPCDMYSISKIAKKKGIVVIEDACHALGASYRHNKKWFKVGNCALSDMVVFSFHPVKSITTGEGGAVLTDRKELYEKLLMLRSHGITKDRSKFTDQNALSRGDWYYEMQLLGFNYRITDFQCAMGIAQLKKLDEFIEKRKTVGGIYSERFDKNPYFDLPDETIGTRSSWHLYPIRLKDKFVKFKKSIFDSLHKKGIGVQVHYLPVFRHPYYEKMGYKKTACPRSEEFYNREISLPIYPSMSKREVLYVIDNVLKTFVKLRNKYNL
jgi:UDP-4-amino-4,6-dideoxy-L-N-acetyl-beta-L-altrosamine transaminase